MNKHCPAFTFNSIQEDYAGEGQSLIYFLNNPAAYLILLNLAIIRRWQDLYVKTKSDDLYLFPEIIVWLYIVRIFQKSGLNPVQVYSKITAGYFSHCPQCSGGSYPCGGGDPLGGGGYPPGGGGFPGGSSGFPGGGGYPPGGGGPPGGSPPGRGGPPGMQGNTVNTLTPPYGTTIPTLEPKLKVENLLEWEGTPNSAVNYFWEVGQLAALGGWLPQALGYWIPSHLKAQLFRHGSPCLLVGTKSRCSCTI
ncbi:hypothetical protein C8J57DRAFT_1217176 [Mycena rebaudengoi]|nr:hypothetical protein C8J57DRAFT_1217176 [Mycena rebaudengoi]